MDGNGRWAESRSMPRIEGHRRGADNIHNIVKYASKYSVKYITLYSFSTENWKRPQEEIDGLMGLLKRFLPKEAKQLKKNNVRLDTIGDISKFSNDVQNAIIESKKITADCDGIVLILALNYGGRNEIIRAVNSLIDNNQDINEDNISNSLDTSEYPDPDLIIRTAGEHRLSNFLAWQSIYSELIFLDVAWPDFSEEDFNNSIELYYNRIRNFGGLTEKD